MFQKTNHFPGSTVLGRKDLLWNSINKLRFKFPRDYNITPLSFNLLEDYEEMQSDRALSANKTQLYIIKPVAASCGRGIKIVDSQQRIKPKEGMLVSRYIMCPHLINGLKYDLRVYVFVTSFNPLTVYIYNDGLVRFATEKYSLDSESINQKFVHLTNFSINKRNTSKFVQNNESDDEREVDSSKWNFSQLESAFEKLGLNYGSIFMQIKQIVMKTLISVESSINNNLEKNHSIRNSCFELYGFDVILDSNLKPWVLEVNVLPSLSSSSVFDKRIKTMLVCDALTLIGIRGYDKLSFEKRS